MLTLVGQFNLFSLKLTLITHKQCLEASEEEFKSSLFCDGLRIQQLKWLTGLKRRFQSEQDRVNKVVIKKVV